MHSTFPRSVLALLRLRSLDFPSGPSIMGKIVDGVRSCNLPHASQFTLYQTFFDTDVDSLIPGPATLDFLADYTSRHVASVDSVISILQVRSRSTFTSLSNQILFLARPPQALRHRAAVRACCRTLRTRAHEDAGATCERGG